jgi:hypothetical protein
MEGGSRSIAVLAGNSRVGEAEVVVVTEWARIQRHTRAQKDQTLNSSRVHDERLQIHEKSGNNMTDPQRSFLVTCVGAYDDSGVGTGGFVCLHEGRALTLDKIDSTGLCEYEGSYYRFARGLRAIVGYDASGMRHLLKVPVARDVHDLVVRGGRFICVSTGTNEVLWIDPLGKVTGRWKAEGERDAWHLNCLCQVDGRLHVAAFGRFSAHRGWVGECSGKGFVFDLESGREVVTGLNGPHNPRFLDETWFICDSHAGALVVQRSGEATRSIPLGGFTRGLAWDEHFLYVGVSADRKAQTRVDYSAIVVLERASFGVVVRFEIPFPEIYEIVPVPAAFSAAVAKNPMAFQIDQAQERFAALEQQVQLGCREIAELRRRLEPLRGVEQVRGRLVQLKRRLVG